MYGHLACVRGRGECRHESDPALPFLVMTWCFIPWDRNPSQEAQVKGSLFQVYKELYELMAGSGGRALKWLLGSQLMLWAWHWLMSFTHRGSQP